MFTDCLPAHYCYYSGLTVLNKDFIHSFSYSDIAARIEPNATAASNGADDFFKVQLRCHRRCLANDVLIILYGMSAQQARAPISASAIMSARYHVNRNLCACTQWPVYGRVLQFPRPKSYFWVV